MKGEIYQSDVYHILNCYLFYAPAFIYINFESQWTEYCEKYAKPEDIGVSQEENSSDDELSEEDYASSDDAIAGQPDP